MEKYGLIHVFYGNGVGKTTRAVGLSVRAAGKGLKVHFVQFMKAGDSGEVAVLQKIENINYHCPGAHPFVINEPKPVHYEHAAKAYQMACQAVEDKPEMLVCDEILNAVFFGVLKVEQVLDLIGLCRGKIELVLTGRPPLPEIIEAGDYVTELVEIKHPYNTGVKPRYGIEY